VRLTMLDVNEDEVSNIPDTDDDAERKRRAVLQPGTKQYAGKDLKAERGSHRIARPAAMRPQPRLNGANRRDCLVTSAYIEDEIV
jgi:hypothetical protein